MQSRSIDFRNKFDDFDDISSVYNKVFNELNLFLKFSINQEISDCSVLAETPDLIYDPILESLEYSRLLAEKKLIDAQVSTIRKQNKMLREKPTETDENDVNSLIIHLSDSKEQIEQLVKETDSLRSENQKLYSIPRLNRLLIPTTGRTKLINKLDQIKKIKSSILQIENEIGYQKYHSEHDMKVLNHNISLIESDIKQLFEQISKTEERCVIFHFPCTLEINNSLGATRPRTSFVPRKEITLHSKKSSRRIKSKTSLSTAVPSSRGKRKQTKAEIQSDNFEERTLRIPRRNHELSKPSSNEISGSNSSSISARMHGPKASNFDDNVVFDSPRDIKDYTSPKISSEHSYNEKINQKPGSSIGSRVKSNDYFTKLDDTKNELYGEISFNKIDHIDRNDKTGSKFDQHEEEKPDNKEESFNYQLQNEKEIIDHSPRSQVSDEEDTSFPQLDTNSATAQVEQNTKPLGEFSPRPTASNQQEEESPFPLLNTTTATTQVDQHTKPLGEFSPRPNASNQQDESPFPTFNQQPVESPFPKLNTTSVTPQTQPEAKPFVDFSPRPNVSNNQPPQEETPFPTFNHQENDAPFPKLNTNVNPLPIQTNNTNTLEAFPKSQEPLTNATNNTITQLTDTPNANADNHFPQFTKVQSNENRNDTPFPAVNFNSMQTGQPNNFILENHIADAYARIAIRGAMAQIKKSEILKDERDADHIIV